MNFTVSGTASDVRVELSVRECVLFQAKSCDRNNSTGTVSVYLSENMLRMDRFEGDVYKIIITGAELPDAQGNPGAGIL